MVNVFEIGRNVLTTMGILGALWTAGDVYDFRPVTKKELLKISDQLEQATKKINDQLEQTGQTIDRFEFKNLLAKREQNGVLEFEEQQKLCRLAAALDYHGVPGC